MSRLTLAGATWDLVVKSPGPMLWENCDFQQGLMEMLSRVCDILLCSVSPRTSVEAQTLSMQNCPNSLDYMTLGQWNNSSEMYSLRHKKKPDQGSPIVEKNRCHFRLASCSPFPKCIHDFSSLFFSSGRVKMWTRWIHQEDFNDCGADHSVSLMEANAWSFSHHVQFNTSFLKKEMLNERNIELLLIYSSLKALC